MDIYENVIIGNFIFSLGVVFGQMVGRTDSPPTSINLLQQTPLDHQLADVLLQGTGFMRLIEFKREENKDEKELSKHAHLMRGLSSPDYQYLQDVSREVHWYIQTKNKGSLVTQIVPYIEFPETKNIGPSLLNFCNSLVEQMLTPPMQDRGRVFDFYLSLVTMCQGSSTSSSGGMVLFTDMDGNLKYLIVEDLRHLEHTLNYAAEKRAEVANSRRIERERTLEQQRSKSVDKGMSR